MIVAKITNRANTHQNKNRRLLAEFSIQSTGAITSSADRAASQLSEKF